jgi:hypothetical protein
MQEHFFIFSHFFYLTKLQKRAILLGFLLIFQGNFYFYVFEYIYWGQNQTLKNTLIKYSLSSLISICIFNPIFTSIYSYMKKGVIFDKKPTKTLFFSGFASPQKCYKTPKKQQQK